MAGGIVVNTINTDTGLFSTNNAYSGIAKAWVNYNGSSQTINSSFNVSSVTRNGTGDYTVNFATSMPNTLYCVAGSCVGSSANWAYAVQTQNSALSTGSVRFTTGYTNAQSQQDVTNASIVIFSN